MDLAELTKLTEEQAREYLERIRWPNGPVCVHCGAVDIVRISGESTRPGLLRCKICRKQFTVTVGTVFERSHIPIRKWFIAFHLMNSSKKGVSSLQLSRELSLDYKSAWHLSHRVRMAMKSGPLAIMLKGKVEVDETYVGGKTRKGIRGRGSERKTPVMALIQRDGNMKARVVERVNAKTLKGAIRETVQKNATIITDEWASYTGIGKEFDGGHKVVRHKQGEYVKDDAHTNTAESWFALLKRGIHGTFHHVSKPHLPRYCDEFEFRWNHRKVTDGERMLTAIQQAEGKRLMYKTPKGRGSADILIQN